MDQFSSLNEPSRDEAGDLLANKNTVATTLRVQTATVTDVYDKYRAQLGFERPYLVEIDCIMYNAQLGK